MEIGILYPYSKERMEKEVKENKKVSLGVEIDSLVDDINILEIQSGYNHTQVIANIKAQLMHLQGKLEIKEGVEDVRETSSDKNS